MFGTACLERSDSCVFAKHSVSCTLYLQALFQQQGLPDSMSTVMGLSWWLQSLTVWSWNEALTVNCILPLKSGLAMLHVEVQKLQVWPMWWRRLSYARHVDDTAETNINIFNSSLMRSYLVDEKNGGTDEMDFWEVSYKLDLHDTCYSKECVFCWNDYNALAYEVYEFLVSWIIYHLLMFSHSYLTVIWALLDAGKLQDILYRNLIIYWVCWKYNVWLWSMHTIEWVCQSSICMCSKQLLTYIAKLIRTNLETAVPFH